MPEAADPHARLRESFTTGCQDGERMQMREVALYTVRDGKVAQEEFLYLMG